MGATMRVGGVFVVRCYDGQGRMRWESIVDNLVTDEGLNYILSVGITNGAQISNWYFGLFSSNSTPAPSWTYASTPATEFTGYDELTRRPWDYSPASGQTVGTTSRSVFSINASANIYGVLLVSNDTKGDTAAPGAVMLSASRFITPKPVDPGDVLEVTYSISVNDDGV